MEISDKSEDAKRNLGGREQRATGGLKQTGIGGKGARGNGWIEAADRQKDCTFHYITFNILIPHTIYAKILAQSVTHFSSKHTMCSQLATHPKTTIKALPPRPLKDCNLATLTSHKYKEEGVQERRLKFQAKC